MYVDKMTMILKVLICASILMRLDSVVAASCYELQQSQLISLNERMNQMIDTISSLLPKSVKKLTTPIPATSTPSVDYVPSATGHEANYYVPAPSYTTPPSAPHIIYTPPSYAPLSAPVAFTPPFHSMPSPTPIQYTPPVASPPEYSFSTLPSFVQQSPRYQYEHPAQFANPIWVPHPAPPLKPPVAYSVNQPPHLAEYTQPYPYEYPSAAPIYANIPFTSGVPLYPLPIPMSPSPYAPVYPNIPELPQGYK